MGGSPNVESQCITSILSRVAQKSLVTEESPGSPEYQRDLRFSCSWLLANGRRKCCGVPGETRISHNWREWGDGG